MSPRTSHLIRTLQAASRGGEATLIPSPLAGYTDFAFRKVLRQRGADHVFMAWVSSHGLERNPEYKAKILADFADDAETNVQIFGNDPAIMAATARWLEALGAAHIDINMGCSVRKVWKAGTGSLLLTDLDNARAICRAVAEAVDVPVSLKTRIGWCSGQDEGLRLCLESPELGIQAITLHGRFAKQGFGGSANWAPIAYLKERLPIPVIANGDIKDGPSARRCLDETHADGLMIGRAQMGNPWVFQEIRHYLRTGELAPEPSWEATIDTALLHLRYMAQSLGAAQGTREFRKHLVKYLIGLPHNKEIKTQALELPDYDAVVELLTAYRAKLATFAPHEPAGAALPSPA